MDNAATAAAGGDDCNRGGGGGSADSAADAVYNIWPSPACVTPQIKETAKRTILDIAEQKMNVFWSCGSSINTANAGTGTRSAASGGKYIALAASLAHGDGVDELERGVGPNLLAAIQKQNVYIIDDLPTKVRHLPNYSGRKVTPSCSSRCGVRHVIVYCSSTSCSKTPPVYVWFPARLTLSHVVCGILYCTALQKHIADTCVRVVRGAGDVQHPRRSFH